MVIPMIIALTGTPGTGKSAICSILSGKGHTILSVLELAKAHDCVVAVDPDRGSKELDIDRLAKALASNDCKEPYLENASWKTSSSLINTEKSRVPERAGRHVVVDGHLSHLLPLDGILLLRCRPDVLEERLVAREWPKLKVQENLEAEVLGVIAGEIMENIESTPLILELDTSNTLPEHAAAAILETLDRTMAMKDALPQTTAELPSTESTCEPRGSTQTQPSIDWLDDFEHILFRPG